ncbi:terpene synthase family protein [Pseudonocardia spinosispora]|uniref:terpene synthase family protein n=1 Tax=Pseudonocardia spinosispora TaxID=103441 RepID=UPI000413FA9A|nr:terpene synthase family protein [Pseudonocardia spinosispora]
MELVIPDQLEQISTPVSPFGDHADSEALRWAKQLGLLRTADIEHRLARTRPGALAAHCYPHAGPEDLCLLAEWMSWLFVLDDQGDEGLHGRRPELFSDALANLDLDTPGNSDDPLRAGLSDLAQRAEQRMSPSWRRRFRRHLADYFTANVWQAGHRRLDEVPDLEVFARMRRDAGAVMPSFDLIEYTESAALPADVYYSRTYQRLLVTSADVVCWTNDLMSLEKELAHGDNQNLVLVLHHERGIPLQDAAHEVTVRTQRQLERFLAAERELPTVCDRLKVGDEVRATADACAAMLKAWMVGHVAWGRGTARYLEVPVSAGVCS